MAWHVPHCSNQETECERTVANPWLAGCGLPRTRVRLRGMRGHRHVEIPGRLEGRPAPIHLANAADSAYHPRTMPDASHEVLDSLSRCKRVLVTTHVRPDGDALG